MRGGVRTSYRRLYSRAVWMREQPERRPRGLPLVSGGKLERTTGFEPATPRLARASGRSCVILARTASPYPGTSESLFPTGSPASSSSTLPQL